MAYVAPLGSTKLVDAASVANGAYCAAALLPITGTRQVIFTVLCDQAFDFDCGTAASPRPPTLPSPSMAPCSSPSRRTTTAVTSGAG